MPTTVQFRRGTSNQLANATGTLTLQGVGTSANNTVKYIRTLLPV